MPILFFILWLLLAGEVTLHVCLWGVVASVILSWFCHQVLAGSQAGDPGQGCGIFAVSGSSGGGNAAGRLCGDAADLYPGEKDGAQTDLV